MEYTESRNGKTSENISEKDAKSVKSETKNLREKSVCENQQEVKINGSKSEEEWLTLTEDSFGTYRDENGIEHDIKRFTWNNKNKIQVKVINYGARIISMKIPDRKGDVDDIVLGFDDIAGYIYYHKYYFGATIGRLSHVVPNGNIKVNKQEYNLSTNHLGKHHFNGGYLGLDQVVWNTHIVNKKVIMTYVSPGMSEGYPGDLFVRITFELSERNEFKIDMEAFSTKPTPVNLSNLTYFNLAGHHRGVDEIYRHVVTLNCNCFTPQVDELPTGEILNVVHTEFDFQIPKVLGKVMGITYKDGFNQNLCVNRAVNQDDCFIGRVLHPPSGRMLEIYSNQYGVHFNTANEFGYGRILSMQEIIPQPTSQNTNTEAYLKLLQKMHRVLEPELRDDETKDYQEMRDLIIKMKKEQTHKSQTPTNSLADGSVVTKSSVIDLVITDHQKEYLEGILKIVCDKEDEENCTQLKSIIERILKYAIIGQKSPKLSALKNLSIKLENNPHETKPSKKKRPSRENIIPSYYKSSDQIIGKERTVYRMHGGIALQTQNYPGCSNFKNFPNCILNPGENYRHTITYKFWVRAGNPNKWIKRNLNEIAQKNLAQ